MMKSVSQGLSVDSLGVSVIEMDPLLLEFSLLKRFLSLERDILMTIGFLDSLRSEHMRTIQVDIMILDADLTIKYFCGELLIKYFCAI